MFPFPPAQKRIFYVCYVMSLMIVPVFNFPFLPTIVFLFPYLFAGNLAEKLCAEPEVKITIFSHNVHTHNIFPLYSRGL